MDLKKKVFSEAKISPVGKVNKADLRSVLHNMVVFLAPLGVIYLLQLSGTLQNGALSIKDFIPTPVTQGALELYVINAILDLLRKFTDGKK